MPDMFAKRTSVSTLIKQEALRIGFAACGISKVLQLKDDAVHLDQWLDEKMHGQMSYMERNRDKRIDPVLLFPNARSVISLAVNYYPLEQQPAHLPQVAKYAYGNDYHKVVKDMLNELLLSIRKFLGELSGRVFCDSAPVLEHAWAARSGLGWIGKHSLLINPLYGSYVLLGELLIDLELPADDSIKNRCGTCTRCIDACPAGAIVKPYVVDARRCLSYLTIEYKGAYVQPVNMHNRVFGCDICQDVCPWNKKAKSTQIRAFEPRQSILQKKADEWVKMGEDEFRQLTVDSPIQRSGIDSLRRNALCLI